MMIEAEWWSPFRGRVGTRRGVLLNVGYGPMGVFEFITLKLNVMYASVKTFL